MSEAEGGHEPEWPEPVVTPPPNKRRRWALGLGIFLAFIILVAVAASFNPNPAPGTGGEDGTEQPTLIDKPASELVITLSDMEAGWFLDGEISVTIVAKGFRDGYWRWIDNEDTFTSGGRPPGSMFQDIETTAWTFESIGDADTYFDGLAQDVIVDYSTESRTFGDEALYWEQTGDFIRMLIRKSNVVWKVTLARQGTFLWDPSIDWVAGTLVLKA